MLTLSLFLISPYLELTHATPRRFSMKPTKIRPTNHEKNLYDKPSATRANLEYAFNTVITTASADTRYQNTFQRGALRTYAFLRLQQPQLSISLYETEQRVQAEVSSGHSRNSTQKPAHRGNVRTSKELLMRCGQGA